MVQIDHLDLKNEESVHSTESIRAIHSTIAQFSFYIYAVSERKHNYFQNCEF
jgi:hypothetical protein